MLAPQQDFSLQKAVVVLSQAYIFSSYGVQSDLRENQEQHMH